MTIDLKRYEALKEKARKAKHRADKAEGVLEQLKQELLDNFGQASLRDARRYLKQLEKDQAEAEAEFNRKLAAFEADFGEVLK